MAAATPSANQPSGDPLGLAGRVALVAELLEVGPGELTDGEIVDGAVALAKLSGLVDAALGAMVGAVDSRAIHTGDGALSPGSWLAARSELTRAHAGGVAARQRSLRGCPHVAEAYRLGLIGTAKVRLLISARDRVEDVFAEHEADLVETLRPLTVDHARFAVARWRALALDLAGLDDEVAPTDPTANSLHVSATSGRYDLSGDLDVVTGSGLVADLDAEIADLFREGRFATDDGLVRSQRQAVALAELTARARARRVARPGTPPHDGDTAGAADPAGTAGTAETDVTVSDPWPDAEPAEPSVDESTDHRAGAGEGEDPTPAAPAAPAVPVVPPGTGPSVSVVVDLALLAGMHDHDLVAALARRCHLGDGTPIPVSCAERLLCTGSIHPVLVDRLLDATTDIAGVTSPARTATRTQRRALVERDRGCVFPGCRAGPARCEAHHVTPWSHGGTTALPNLVLLCRHHHHACHEGGFTLTATDGTVTVTRPDGTTLPRTRHGDIVTEPLTTTNPCDPPGTATGDRPDTGTGSRAPSRYRDLTHRLGPRERRLLDQRRRRHAGTTLTRLGFPPPQRDTFTTERWRFTRIDAA